VARHIVSHAVTVTERDTVLRASRHIRPPRGGGAHVTRDQIEGSNRGKGRNHLVISMRVLMHNAHHMHDRRLDQPARNPSQ
jgi:hypothetical protein